MNDRAVSHHVLKSQSFKALLALNNSKATRRILEYRQFEQETEKILIKYVERHTKLLFKDSCDTNLFSLHFKFRRGGGCFVISRENSLNDKEDIVIFYNS